MWELGAAKILYMDYDLSRKSIPSGEPDVLGHIFLRPQSAPPVYSWDAMSKTIELGAWQGWWMCKHACKLGLLMMRRLLVAGLCCSLPTQLLLVDITTLLKSLIGMITTDVSSRLWPDLSERWTIELGHELGDSILPYCPLVLVRRIQSFTCSNTISSPRTTGKKRVESR